jgi:hypothetical protein
LGVSVVSLNANRLQDRNQLKASYWLIISKLIYNLIEIVFSGFKVAFLPLMVGLRRAWS